MTYQMAKCPVCFRRVSFTNLLTGRHVPIYTCQRCGRFWSFTYPTLTVAAVLSISPFVWLAFSVNGNSKHDVALVVESFIAGVLIYFGFLSLFGHLGPVRTGRRVTRRSK